MSATTERWVAAHSDAAQVRPAMGRSRRSIALAARYWAAPAALIASLLLSCLIRSYHKYFWTDEIFSLRLITAPSASYLLRALGAGADGSPPLYYLAARPWVRLFGSSDVALRLFSWAALALAVLAIWGPLRRAFGGRAAAVGVLVAFGTSELVLYQNVEVRFYGLLVALCALALRAYAAQARSDATPWTLWMGTALIHAGLVLTHAFGILYSGAVLGALVVWDVASRRRLRLAAYLPVLAGWTAFIPWLGPFAVQRALTRPRNWTPRPTWDDLLASYQFGIVALAVVVIAVVVLAAVETSASETDGNRRQRARDANASGASALVVLALAFFTVPLAVFVVSRGDTSIFVPRYFVPCVIAWAVLLGALVSGPAPIRLEIIARFSHGARRWLLAGTRGAWLVMYVALLLYPLYWAKSQPWTDHPGADIRASGIADLPVVFESAHRYLPLTRYPAFPAQRYYFLLDSASAFSPTSAAGTTLEFKIMRAHRRFLDPEGVILQPELLCRYRRFLLVDIAARPWFEWNIAENPVFHVSIVPRAGGDDPWRPPAQPLLLVERDSASPLPACPPRESHGRK